MLMPLGIRHRRTMGRDGAKGISLAQNQIAEFCIAEARCILQHRLEYRLQIARRGTDDLQYLRGRRLLLERFTEITRALAQLVEQARVLDGDDGLCSEILQQSNLPILKRPDFLPIDENCANQSSLSEQRHGNAGSGTAKLGARRFRSFCNEVCAVDDLPRPKHTIEKLSCRR